jgi:serine/threonine-protein kinase
VPQPSQQSLLYGEYVQVVRNAMEEKKAIVGAVTSLSTEDKALLPPVVPTATALVDRVCSIAQALHRMDSTLNPGALASLDARLAALRAEPATAEREQRLAMLERQRESAAGLERRRDDMQTQMDGAMIALMNLKLDMLRLNAEGLGSVLSEVTSATQEARALSREISRIVDAAGEVKKL